MFICHGVVNFNIRNKDMFGLTEEDGIKEMCGEKGLLRSNGWLRTYVERYPVDASGMPLPWYTYASIEFLRTRVDRTMRVFEYGCGYSTLWYGMNCLEVVSVEHSPVFCKFILEEVVNRQMSNVSLILREDENSYCDGRLNAQNCFDIVCCDGIEEWRNRTIMNSVGLLTEKGVIVLDNAQDIRYAHGIDYLKRHGFKAIDFAGLTPVCTVSNNTSIFYRKENVFGI